MQQRVAFGIRVADGQKRLQRGRADLREGEGLLAEGEELVREGDALLANGREKMEAAEQRYSEMGQTVPNSTALDDDE